MPEDTYANYTRLAKENGVRVILDADGEALRQGIEAKPYLVKPNLTEAEHLLGRPLRDTKAALGGARELARRGIGVVVISMGARGAVCVAGDQAWLLHPPEVERRSTVGSGDSFVAGLAVALARGDELPQALSLGTAAGAATAMASGTSLGTAATVKDLLPRVRIEEIAGSLARPVQ
jgi:1-phosphofructokinase family hexose kinase